MVKAVALGVLHQDRASLGIRARSKLMPTALQRFCPGSPTCPHRVSAFQPCPVHGSITRNSRRPTDPRYGTERWRRYSERRRAEHPFCVDCGALADCTDHILSVRTNPDLFWEPSNHASRCTRCNTVKGS